MGTIESHDAEALPDNLVELSRQIATEAHKGQHRRDGATPYIEHPAAVVSRAPKSPLAQAAAWLHDVLEDTKLTRSDLLDRGVPESVVCAVEALTKKKGLSYEENLRRAASNELARGVKIADIDDLEVMRNKEAVPATTVLTAP